MNLEQLKEQLVEKLEELKGRAHEIEEKLSDPGNPDWEENATEMEDDEVRIGIGNLTKNEIHEIEETIRLIDAGEYGRCTVCGSDIGAARLKALPFTLTCVSCA
ncbi:MAG: TraR/DksA C4-type zinc finger protein [Pirellulaceae bacterium]